MKPMTTLTELEQRLSAPDGEAVRQALLAQLSELHARLRQQLAASVPRADYENLAAQAQAAQAAREVLQAWPLPVSPKTS